MDYKQKYEQLAKFIKDLYPHMSDYCKEKTEGMIPELKESEDERIRKWLIRDIKRSLDDDVYNDESIDNAKKALAWLEKQGNRKPEIKYIYPKFRVGDVIEPAKPNGSCIPVRVKYIGEGSYSCESDDRNAFLSLPICKENEYVLIEQKSVGWSEEDEKLSIKIKYLIHNYIAGDVEHKLCSWIDSLKERVQPQSKQEWTKEDETCLEDVLWAIEQARPIAKKENVLDNLRHAEKWLKSLILRPYWKPTNGQMKILRKYVMGE